MLFNPIPYINYYVKAQSSLYIHSPFVFDFCQNVLNAHKEYYAFKHINQYKKSLEQNNQLIKGNDAGMGSHSHIKNRTVAHYARLASMPEKYGYLLFKTVAHYNCMHILELGTCLGVGTAYMAMANPNASVISIEGNTELAKVAFEGLKGLALTHITVLNNLFENILPKVNEFMPQIDLVFIDGNHTYASTIGYFETLLPLIHSKTILIFDDINWSGDMAKAWKYIKLHPFTTITINVGRMGFVWIDNTLPKQEFILRYHVFHNKFLNNFALCKRQRNGRKQH